MADKEVENLVNKVWDKLKLKIENGEMDDTLYKHAHEYLCNAVEGVFSKKTIASKMENACVSVIQKMKTEDIENAIVEFLKKTTLDACKDQNDDNSDENTKSDENKEIEEREPTNKNVNGGKKKKRKHRKTRRK